MENTPCTRKNDNKEPCRLRIAMVCDFFYPNLGGVENHIYSLSQKLIQRGHKVVIITHRYVPGRQGVRYLPGPLKVYYCPVVTLGSSANVGLPTFTASLPLLRWILVRERIDIVHTHQATSTLGSECIVYAAMMGIPTVYTDHSLFGFSDVASVILNRVLQVSLATIDAGICVSYTCRDNFVLRTQLTKEKEFTGKRKLRSSSEASRSRPQVHVIPNAVDSSQFVPHRLKGSVSDTDRIKVIVISRLVYRKGVDLLVGIIPNVCRLLKNVDFIVGGNGNKLLQLQEMVERENLQHRVEFLGSVPHSQVRDVLIRGHVFLNCSLTESFCIAILEAASCGLLVVSTNVGGVPEVLPADDMMLMARPNVPDMVKCVVNAVERQLLQPVDPWQMHDRVKNMYSWDRVAKETEAVYNDLRLRPKKSLEHRLAAYQSALSGFSGIVACILAIIVEMWYQCVERFQPRERIDLIPDV